MRRRRLFAAVAGASLFTAGGLAIREPRPPDVPAARQALRRLLPAHHDQFRLSLGPGVSSFSVRGRAGAIQVEASEVGMLLAGVRWYLTNVTKVDISWPGDSLHALPDTLPAVPRPVSRGSAVTHRFALNDTHEGYTGPYRRWSDWERDLDLLAAHGYTEVLLTPGHDAVYLETFREFGYSPQELREWIPQPGHQPWWLLQNMADFTGPISAGMIESRLELAQRVFARTRELGMTPVLPGYFGTVPPEFARRNAGARVVPQGLWLGFQRPDWLEPTTEIFDEVARRFYRCQAELVGATSLYKMDMLHEGGTAGDVDLADAATGVWRALRAARPDAHWVMIGWGDNRVGEIVKAVDPGSMLIVDGMSDRYDDLNRERDWHLAPYAFGTIPNFGGRTSLGANGGVWARRFEQWRVKSDSALDGVAWMPEGAGRDPAAFALFSDFGWRGGEPELTTWFASWADRRYGGPDVNAREAWDVLRRTVYDMPSGEYSCAAESLFAARPDLDAVKASTWAPESVRYDAAVFDEALSALLRVRRDLRGDAYRYDLVDVSRQALANGSRVLLPRIAAAFSSGRKSDMERLTERWLSLMDLLDRLLGCDTRFMVGPWLSQARAAAQDAEDAAALEYDARTLLTVWGPRQASEDGRLRDYGNREWAGLVSGLYKPRWELFFETLLESLRTGDDPRWIDWFEMEHRWAAARELYPVEAGGDVVALAGEARDAARALTSDG